MKKLLIVALTAVFAMPAMADGDMKGSRDGKRMERAQAHQQQLSQALNLSEEQRMKLKDFMKSKAADRKAHREEKKSNMQDRRDQMKDRQMAHRDRMKERAAECGVDMSGDREAVREAMRSCMAGK